MSRFLTFIGGFLALALSQPSLATAPRMSVSKLAGEVAPHVVAYEYPPLVTGDAAAPGAAVEIVTQAFAAAGKPLAVENFPSKKFALQLLEEDTKAVAMLGEARALTAAERKSLAEEKIFSLAGKYFYYTSSGKDLSKVNDISALKGLTYGTIAEEASDSLSRAGIKVINDEPKLLLRKLQNKEIDFISAFGPNAESMIASLFPGEKDHFAVMPLKAWESTFSLWFDSRNKVSKEWRTAFADGLKKIKASGAYGDILKKYGLEDAALK
ncbi:MAG: substrate-binding periplasmic protein [Methylomonas sp.]